MFEDNYYNDHAMRLKLITTARRPFEMRLPIGESHSARACTNIERVFGHTLLLRSDSSGFAQ